MQALLYTMYRFRARRALFKARASTFGFRFRLGYARNDHLSGREDDLQVVSLTSHLVFSRTATSTCCSGQAWRCAYMRTVMLVHNPSAAIIYSLGEGPSLHPPASGIKSPRRR